MTWRVKLKGAALSAGVLSALLVVAPAHGAVHHGEGIDTAVSEGRIDDGVRPEDHVPLPREVVVEAASKAELAAAWVALKEGQGSVAEVRARARSHAERFGAHAADISSVDALVREEAVAQGEQPRSAAASVPAARAAATSKLLSTGSVAQATNYYCGPAAAYNIIKHKGKATSAYNRNHSLSQATLAGSTYLKTDINQATTWSSGAMRTGLNRWFGGGDNYRYVASATPTAALMKNALVYDIDNNWALAIETYESKTSLARYNKHPRGKIIGHWVTGRGYSNSGDTLHIADPSYRLWGGSSYYSHATTDFTNKFLQVHGIVW